MKMGLGLGMSKKTDVSISSDFTSAIPSGFVYTRNDAVTTYRDSSGIMRVAAIDAPPFDHTAAGVPLGLRFQPGATNKITAYNASPTDTTGITKIGAGAAGMVLSIVDDTAALTAAGLQSVGNAKVIKIDNTSGGGDAGISFSGTSGNTNSHVMSMYYRTETGGAGYISTTNGNGVTVFSHSASYSRLSSAAFTAASNDQMAILVSNTKIAYIVLPQFEESAILTDPIIVAGSAGTRAAPLLNRSQVWFSEAGGFSMKYRDEYPRQAVGGLECLFHLGDGINDRQTVFKGTGGDLLFKTFSGGSDTLDYTFDADALAAGPQGVGMGWKSDLVRCAVNGIEVNTNATVTLPTSYDFGLSIGTYEGSLFPTNLWLESVTLFRRFPSTAQLEAATRTILEV